MKLAVHLNTSAKSPLPALQYIFIDIEIAPPRRRRPSYEWPRHILELDGTAALDGALTHPFLTNLQLIHLKLALVTFKPGTVEGRRLEGFPYYPLEEDHKQADAAIPTKSKLKLHPQRRKEESKSNQKKRIEKVVGNAVRLGWKAELRGRFTRSDVHGHERRKEGRTQGQEREYKNGGGRRGQIQKKSRPTNPSKLMYGAEG
ncbi:hypothetical protein CPB84DRAFT_1746201 [Gymnopilus junonius]|uniref:Uncharacterized protein n=1 Tax=Gymnopilus junonius TaxID=109634 RepID=A0A9P5NS79_GYMJU|nr:hypothetical protein CPB84DRAFT_1746201 [Gymnopilus junonius]